MGKRGMKILKAAIISTCGFAAAEAGAQKLPGFDDHRHQPRRHRFLRRRRGLGEGDQRYGADAVGGATLYRNQHAAAPARQRRARLRHHQCGRNQSRLSGTEPFEDRRQESLAACAKRKIDHARLAVVYRPRSKKRRHQERSRKPKASASPGSIRPISPSGITAMPRSRARGLLGTMSKSCRFPPSMKASMPLSKAGLTRPSTPSARQRSKRPMRRSACASFRSIARRKAMLA